MRRRSAHRPSRAAGRGGIASALLCCVVQLLLFQQEDADAFIVISLPSSVSPRPRSLDVTETRPFCMRVLGMSTNSGGAKSGNTTPNDDDGDDESPPSLTVVVVGGGWAGFSAADALASSSTKNQKIQIHLLDASPRGPGGLASGGWRSPKLGLPVEAGIHGFWREYRNTFATMERLGLDLDRVLTPYTPSLLVSSSGRVALAPVLGGAKKATSSSRIDSTAPTTTIDDWTNPSRVAKQLAELLPPPLDVALLSEFNPDSPLTVVDRLSGIGLLGAWADFGPEDDASWLRYDTVSAESLFRQTVSPQLYTELVTPLLHVLPMTPGYDCSAAAALSCFHAFALQAAGAFDVRWCRGSISEMIFDPWVEQLQQQQQQQQDSSCTKTTTGAAVEIRGSARVTSITENTAAAGATTGETNKKDESSSASQKPYTVTLNDSSDTIDCDAVILAVGATAAGRLIDACPPLLALPGKYRDQWKQLRGITCVAVRLFLKFMPRSLVEAMKDTPVTVCGPKVGNLPLLVETGFCIYDLTRLQDWCGSSSSSPSSSSLEMTAVVEVDYFRADAIAALDDASIVDLALQSIEAALDVQCLDRKLVVDAAIVRARSAVSHFCVGSASLSPPVKLTKGLYMCGDWVDRRGHASWSTEKAVVTGRQAAAAVALDFKLDCDNTDVIPAAPDTPQLAELRRVSTLTRKLGLIQPKSFPMPPWASLAK